MGELDRRGYATPTLMRSARGAYAQSIRAHLHAAGVDDLPRNGVFVLAGHVLMGTDMLASMGHELRPGNNVTVNLEPGSRSETQRLYAELSEGGSESTGLQDMPWGFWGCTLDRFGVRWMFTGPPPSA